jgi:outer membrane protein TolC
MQMKQIIILLLITFSQGIFSQDKTWTLEECVHYAIRHNLQRIKQEAQNEIYKHNQREAIGSFLPSLNAATSASMNFGRGLDPETNGYISTSNFSNMYEIYSSLVLFDGFSRIYRAKTANINRLKGNEELQAIKDEIAFDVMEIFFNALYYKGTMELAEEQLDESVGKLKKFQRMEELGLVSIPDLAEVQAKEAEDRFLLTKQTKLYNLEIIKLKEKMNLPVEEDLLIEACEPIHLVSNEPENTWTIYQQAQNTLPKALASAKTLSATEMEHKALRGNLLPSLSLRAGFSSGFSRMIDGNVYMPFWEQLKMKEGSYVGLTLSIPLFNGFSRSSEMKRSKQRLIIAQNQHEEILRQVYSEIEQVVADVNGLSDEYLHAQKRTIAMQVAHQMNLRKYEEGLIDLITLATSANRLLNSRVEELYINLRYQLKYKLLNYYKTINY